MTWWSEAGHNYYGRRDSLAADLNPYRISVAELFIMDQVDWYWGVGVCLSRSRLAVDAFETNEPWPGLHCEDYLHAIDGLVEKALLQRITQEQAKTWQKSLSGETIPSCENTDLVYGPGEIYFAPSGYELYGRIQREVFGCVRLGVRLDPDEKQVVILSEDEAAIRNETARQAEYTPFDSAQSTDDRPVKARLKRILGLTTIGPWRLSRFEVVPSGFMTVLEYE